MIIFLIHRSRYLRLYQQTPKLSMKKLLLIFNILLIISCNDKNSQNKATEAEVRDSNEKTYYIVMSFTIEDQNRKELNHRFERFNTSKFDPISVYVSDVEQITTSGSITEDQKSRKLDAYEKYMLRPPVKDYIIIDRTFEVYDTYSEASQARMGID